MINRLFLEDIKRSMDFFSVIGIIGPRQCGKTTLVKQLIAETDRAFCYLDCEYPPDVAKLTDPVLFFETNRDKCVVIDEIQVRADLFPIIRSMVDRKREPGRFIILGSASPELIRNSSESLAGRISYKELSPFNIQEINSPPGLITHWFRGGFPDAFLQDNDSLRREWYYNFIRTYVERDLPRLGMGLSPTEISRFWKMLATTHGGLLNKSNLSKSLGISYPTISRYLDFLEETFLITQLRPYDTNEKKRLVKSPKVYIRDSGLLHHQLSIQNFEDLQAHSFLGVSWEGYVIEQIKQVLPIGYELFFYRTHEGTELDLVIIRGNKPFYGVEIKYSSVPVITKSLKIAIEDLKPERSFIIVPTTEEFLIREDITVCGLLSFLKMLHF